jgi:methyl-accepting chemotaxis protein-1 (serine sensor receptor)
VLAIFGLLQLTSGGLFFNALKHDKENFTVLQTIRQQQSTLNGSWVALLQTRNTLNRAGIRYMMDQNNIGSGATVNDLMQIASASLKQAEKNWADYEALPRDPRQNDAAALEIKRNYDIYHGVHHAVVGTSSPTFLPAGRAGAPGDPPYSAHSSSR